MLLGIPAACTRLRATERLIPADDGAVAYFESDDVAGLAALLVELAASPELRALQAKRGCELWARLGTDVQRRRYESAVARARLRRM